jgi:tRNA modification GTPase
MTGPRRRGPPVGLHPSSFIPRPSPDTICALATPAGTGSIAVIRVSGARTLAILDRFLPTNPPSRQRSHTVRLGWFASLSREPVDQVLVTVFRSPRSYTGEDMAEISCHGGAVAADSILKLLTGVGCRIAEPGEFTRRAVLAGKMTLSQAEAVADMAEARSEPAFRCALDRFRGGLSGLVTGVAQDLNELLAEIEYKLGFDECGANSGAVPRTGIRRIAARLGRIITSAERGRFLIEGATVAIIGRPNAGKSSLFNRLVESERAITSPVPGTTRDRVDAATVLSGVPVQFIDTAGLTRRAGTRLSRQAIAQTGRAVGQADVIVAVFDSSRPGGLSDSAVIAAIHGRRAVCVLNKVDLASRFRRSSVPGCPSRLVPVSCRTGFGIGRFRSRLARALSVGHGPRLAFNRRQLESLSACREALGRAGSARNLETSALEVRLAIDMLNQIDAPAADIDVLDRVFARFCVGK